MAQNDDLFALLKQVEQSGKLSPGLAHVDRHVVPILCQLSLASFSGEHSLHHVARDIGEAEVTAHVAVSETGVLEAEALEDGRLEIVDVDSVLGDLEAEVVGLADDLAALDASAG